MACRAFVDDVTLETVATLVAHGVLIARAYSSARPELPPLSSRFFDYLEFLACRADEYEHVMLTDLRDVVFQSDPFAVPLPADIVFAQERCLIGAPTANYGWIFDTYGEAVAHNMRDCFVSCAGTTFGTTSGIMRYLVAMTRELRDTSPPFVVGLDQAVHNYIVRMRPLRNAWVDTTDSLVATMHFVPDESVRTTPQGVLIDGRLVPVVHQWDRNKATLDYVWMAPQFKLEAAQRSPRLAPPASPGFVEPPAIEPRDAIVAFYHRPRDANWLAPFFGSLRCAGFAGGMHCVAHSMPVNWPCLHGLGVWRIRSATPTRRWISRISPTCASAALDELAEMKRGGRPGAGAGQRPGGFQRDPFQARTIGLSVF
jgi:hypothetical protein